MSTNSFHVSVGGLGVLAKIERLIEDQLRSGDLYAVHPIFNGEELGQDEVLIAEESSRPSTASKEPSRPVTADSSFVEVVDEGGNGDFVSGSLRPGTSKSQKSAKQKDRFILTISENVIAAKLKNSETTNIAAFGMSGLENVPLAIFEF